MSYQEKRCIANIFFTILIYAGYCVYAWQRLQSGGQTLANDLSFWGTLILIFVPVSIVARILIEVALAVANAASGSEEDPTFSDERDKTIQLKASRFSTYVFTVGFLLAMYFLVVERPAAVMVNTIFLSLNLGEVAESLAQLFYYRRGG